MLRKRRRLGQRSGLSAEDVLDCRKLYASVLDDVLTTLKYPFQHLQQQMRLRVAGGDSQRDELIRRKIEQDRRWVLSDDDSLPFSFIRCCAVMNLDPDAVRSALRRQGLLSPPADLMEKGLARPRRHQRAGGWAARTGTAA